VHFHARKDESKTISKAVSRTKRKEKYARKIRPID